MADNDNPLLQLLYSNASPERQLEAAITNEDVETIRQLVTSGQVAVNASLSAQTGVTPLHAAARADKAAAVRALLDLGAQPMAENFLKQTPLHSAIGAGATRALLLLLRWAPAGWQQLLHDSSRLVQLPRRPDENFTSFTLHLLLGLMQPPPNSSSSSWSIAVACFAAYNKVVDMTTETAADAEGGGSSGSSPFLAGSCLSVESVLSALFGVSSLSPVAAAAASVPEAAALVASVSRLLQLRQQWRRLQQPLTLRQHCRCAVRRHLACRTNYLHDVHCLPLDFATKHFLTYRAEVELTITSRPRSRYS